MLIVIKDQIESKMSERVWELIGKENNKEGWVIKPSTPPEVKEINSKKFLKENESKKSEIGKDI